jgi:anti-sigma regulatory factor (Ser/Thr protein kinase)
MLRGPGDGDGDVGLPALNALVQAASQFSAPTGPRAAGSRGEGRLRSALRAYALDTEDPAELLGRLDRKVRHFEPAIMATVLCAVVAPTGDQIRLPAAILDLPADLPVGVAERLRHTSVMALPAGTTMCLYTDGLIERRGQSLTIGLERLCRAVLAGPAESVCAAVMSDLVGVRPPDDDIAVLVVRRPDATRTDPLNLQLPAVPASLKAVRTAIRHWLARTPATRADTADLVAAVGEACANSIEHAYGPAGGDLSVRLTAQLPHITAVIDDSGQWRPSRGQLRGRGITLMHALADEVQIQRTDVGTHVVIRRTLSEGGHS